MNCVCVECVCVPCLCRVCVLCLRRVECVSCVLWERAMEMTRISCPWTSSRELEVISELHSLLSRPYGPRLGGHWVWTLPLWLWIIHQKEMSDCGWIFYRTMNITVSREFILHHIHYHFLIFFYRAIWCCGFCLRILFCGYRRSGLFTTHRCAPPIHTGALFLIPGGASLPPTQNCHSYPSPSLSKQPDNGLSFLQ